MQKTELSERDICSKYITPAVQSAGWDLLTQIREEVTFTAGRIIVRGKLHTRGKSRRADYVLYHRPNQPIAVIEAKDNTCSVGHGMQQALGYAEALDVPFVFSSNGDGFIFHDRTGLSNPVEQNLTLDQFPTPADLWQRYKLWKGIDPPAEGVIDQPYYTDGSGREPRYYQRVAINRTVEAIAKGEDRLLLVMATGTGKTYTAFQIIWRLWKSRTKKRIPFLADRNILIDQTKTNDFKPFGTAMTKIVNREANKAFEIYLSLYQAVTGTEEEQNIYKQFSPDFFDLIVIDECHRGSAAEDSAWREILDYFSSATHVGLTATPKDRVDVVVTNPPFGGTEEGGIEANFPATFRTRETADLFLVLITHLLKNGGRAAIVLPDGTLFGEGVKTRIKEKLLTECNLHTVVRLPNGVFNPYTGIKTNLLFFTKGEPTKDVWYYEHPYPAGAKSYNKTRPMRIEEFAPEKAWWGGEERADRQESEQAWKVSVEQIKANGYNLDIKNPNTVADALGDPEELLAEYKTLLASAAGTREKLKRELMDALNSES